MADSQRGCQRCKCLHQLLLCGQQLRRSFKPSKWTVITSTRHSFTQEASEHLREAERGKLGWGGSQWAGQVDTIQDTWQIQLPLAQCNLIDQWCSAHILDINIQLIPGRLKAHEDLHYYEPSPTLQHMYPLPVAWTLSAFVYTQPRKTFSWGGKSLPLVWQNVSSTTKIKLSDIPKISLLPHHHWAIPESPQFKTHCGKNAALLVIPF